MVMSKAGTVAEYLEELPDDRRKTLVAVRRAIRKHLPAGYKERMNFGMITWEVPLKRYPDTYNGQPLCFLGLASQKNYCSLYLMGVYGDKAKEATLREAFRKIDRKMDMGKSCLRFKELEDIPLDAIGEMIAGIPPEELIARAEKTRKRSHQE